MTNPIVWDVVCGMSTELGNWASSATYNDKTYYFCCDGCKGAFEKSPEYHLENFAEEHPGVEATPA